jgi:hypothetical protein
MATPRVARSFGSDGRCVSKVTIMLLCLQGLQPSVKGQALVGLGDATTARWHSDLWPRCAYLAEAHFVVFQAWWSAA